jgi:hypothetical protein
MAVSEPVRVRGDYTRDPAEQLLCAACEQLQL